MIINLYLRFTTTLAVHASIRGCVVYLFFVRAPSDLNVDAAVSC